MGRGWWSITRGERGFVWVGDCDMIKTVTDICLYGVKGYEKNDQKNSRTCDGGRDVRIYAGGSDGGEVQHRAR